MSEGMSSRDEPLISHLLNAEELDPADLDAVPRKLLLRSLRRLIDETGDPTAEFLWFPNQTSDPGGLRSGRRGRSGSGGDAGGDGEGKR
ncbi:hypothetical protein [Micromonospora sp. NBC_01412]|uniref:hypothetical protein n=1 Tax=Micromonospora sp. NBC_01412 TaxID=2903590 RepID=UPI00324468D4